MTDRMVGVSVRFVPAGFVKSTGDTWLLRGTLTLAPVVGPPADACGGRKIDISRWPQAIEGLIGQFDGSDRPNASALAVMISAVDDFGDQRDRPYPTRGTWRPMVRGFARKQSMVDNDAKGRKDARANQIKSLGELWTSLLAPSGDEDWASLMAALDMGSGPEGSTPSKPAAERLARTRVDGTGDKKVPDVLPTGRGEMGLLLALERGRSVLERLRDPTDAAAEKVVPRLPPDRDGRRGERLRTRAPRTTDATLAVLPWLDMVEPGRVRYAQATTSDADRPPAPASTAESRAVAELSLNERQRLQRFASAEARAAASKRLNQGVEGERKRTDAQADARRSYINAKSSADVEKGLLGLTNSRVACVSPAESRDCVASDRPKEFDGALQRLRVLHAAATRVDELDPQKQVALDERSRPVVGVEAARARFFALQSQPALARLFNLAVDVVIPLDEEVLKDMEAARAHDEVVASGRRAEARYLFVTAGIGLPCQRLVWTTCKIRLNGSREPTHFWACTREELDARAIGWSQDEVLDRAVSTQRDGLLDLGAARIEDGICNPRFDLQTIDAPRVSETELQTATKVQATETKITPVRTLASAGLILVDRWRQSQAVFQAVASTERREQAKMAGPRDEVVDVEDLTVGLKLDLGIDIAGKRGTERAWRSLVEREIAFSRRGKPLFEAELRTLVPNEVERRELFSAILTLPSRLRTNGAQEGKVSESNDTPLPTATAFVEEVVAQWHGLPLGVDLEGGEIPLAETGLLQLSQTYRLPGTPDWPRPPRQRFGWPYRVGVRPQLAGGVVLSLKEATTLYDAGYLYRFALPKTGDGNTGRRVLRHERIEGPVIATPLDILQRRVRGPQETATELVVRSRASETKLGSAPTFALLDRTSTHRILVPPPVSLDFADRHDVFEPKPGREPPGGLRAVDYDRRPKGGFPVWSTQEKFSGKVYPEWNPAECSIGADRRDTCSYPEPTGDAVFKPIAAGIKPEDRKVAYYPDPAADYMVLRLRRPNGGEVYGKSLVVPIRQNGVTFPEVTPVVIDVVAALRRSGKEPTQERILELDVGTGAEAFVSGHAGLRRQPAAVFVDAGERVERMAGSGRVRATRVRVLLEPGESFQLDAWCLPTTENLLEWFDVIESAALVAGAFGRTPATCHDRAKFLEGVADFLGRELAAIETWARNSDWNGRDDQVGCGGGQLPLPPRSALECVARLIGEGMLSAVMPEVAARTTIRCTHAIDRPALPPSFDLAGAPQPDRPRRFALQRLDAAERAKTLAENASGDFQLVESWSDERAIPGSTDVVLGGTVSVDLATTRFLEVRASGPALVSAAFDDPRRGRSVDDRARGIWPNDAERDAAKPIWRRPSTMFGFEVREDGTVDLPAEQATLLRLEDLGPVNAPPGLRQFDLLARQRERVISEVESPRLKTPSEKVERVTQGVVYPDRTPDTKARILTVELVAGSKTAPLIWDANGAALGADQQVATSATRRVALPSTKAPAKVDPLSLLPAFVTERTTLTGSSTQPTLRLVRTARLRLRARRPWFSSGEGERLGVVLWPPEILDGGIDANADLAHRGYDVEGDEQERMNLRGFSDLDLGPGGEFVSRWGADPIKAGARPRGWLLSPAQFRDVPFGAHGQPRGRAERKSWTPLKDGADRDEVIYVPRARMPLPVEPAVTFKPAAAPSSPAVSPQAPTDVASHTMEVALLAYRPRFDVDAEHWYFDLDIDPLEVPEPFVRLGLVRYQANAPSGLRVSEPVVEWAQLLPRREVEVLPNGRRITVTVKGAGSHLPISTNGGAATREDASTAPMEHGPLMTMVVYRRSADGIEMVAKLAAPNLGQDARRDHLPLRTDTPTSPCEPERLAHERAEEAVRPKQDGAGLWWEAVFDLDEDPQSPAEQGASYAVVVAEVILMRPSTYPEEPFDPAKAETEDRLMSSGPRFAARVAIPRRDAPKPSRALATDKSTFLFVHGES